MRKGLYNMKIQLPNGKKHSLDETISLEDKVKVVEDLTSEWNEVIIQNWNSNSIRFFLDSLANYLVWHKDDVSDITEDKEVMSKNKTNRLHRGRKDIPFSSLSTTDREKLFGEVRGAE
jgi:hypothetical protein